MKKLISIILTIALVVTSMPASPTNKPEDTFVLRPMAYKLQRRPTKEQMSTNNDNDAAKTKSSSAGETAPISDIIFCFDEESLDERFIGGAKLLIPLFYGLRLPDRPQAGYSQIIGQGDLEVEIFALPIGEKGSGKFNLVFRRSDAAKVAQLAGTELINHDISLLDADGKVKGRRKVAIISRGLDKIFVGDSKTLYRKFHHQLKDCPNENITINIGGVKYSSLRMTINSPPVWSFDYDERRKAAKHFGLTLREDVPKGRPHPGAASRAFFIRVFGSKARGPASPEPSAPTAIPQQRPLAPNEKRIETGMRVKHPEYGLGTVKAYTTDPDFPQDKDKQQWVIVFDKRDTAGRRNIAFKSEQASGVLKLVEGKDAVEGVRLAPGLGPQKADTRRAIIDFLAQRQAERQRRIDIQRHGQALPQKPPAPPKPSASQTKPPKSASAGQIKVDVVKDISRHQMRHFLRCALMQVRIDKLKEFERLCRHLTMVLTRTKRLAGREKELPQLLADKRFLSLLEIARRLRCSEGAVVSALDELKDFLLKNKYIFNSVVEYAGVSLSLIEVSKIKPAKWDSFFMAWILFSLNRTNPELINRIERSYPAVFGAGIRLNRRNVNQTRNNQRYIREIARGARLKDLWRHRLSARKGGIPEDYDALRKKRRVEEKVFWRLMVDLLRIPEINKAFYEYKMLIATPLPTEEGELFYLKRELLPDIIRGLSRQEFGELLASYPHLPSVQHHYDMEKVKREKKALQLTRKGIRAKDFAKYGLKDEDRKQALGYILEYPKIRSMVIAELGDFTDAATIMFWSRRPDGVGKIMSAMTDTVKQDDLTKAKKIATLCRLVLGRLSGGTNREGRVQLRRYAASVIDSIELLKRFTKNGTLVIGALLIYKRLVADLARDGKYTTVRIISDYLRERLSNVATPEETENLSGLSHAINETIIAVSFLEGATPAAKLIEHIGKRYLFELLLQSETGKRVIMVALEAARKEKRTQDALTIAEFCQPLLPKGDSLYLYLEGFIYKIKYIRQDILELIMQLVEEKDEDKRLNAWFQLTKKIDEDKPSVQKAFELLIKIERNFEVISFLQYDESGEILVRTLTLELLITREDTATVASREDETIGRAL